MIFTIRNYFMNKRRTKKDKNAYDIILHINWTDKKLVYLHNSSIPKEQL